MSRFEHFIHHASKQQIENLIQHLKNENDAVYDELIDKLLLLV